ncbi:MAG: electron transport complex subunit RsxB [Moraxellaceae bacterium]|nr:electron transport complex subunit RsxB [Moraxellaceae bacterium]
MATPHTASPSSHTGLDRQKLIARIESVLPQTQCGKCNHAGCRPYATAIVDGEADINQCPPGGDAGIRKLAALLGRTVLALNPANGEHRRKAVALIDENLCIGCTLCIQACPVDAILGATKQMHTVIVRDCTGCELCIAPCPVDCISMAPAAIWKPTTPPVLQWQVPRQPVRVADSYRARFEARNARLERDRREKAERLAMRQRTQAVAQAASTSSTAAPLPGIDDAEARKKALIAAALERARAQRAAVQPANTSGLTSAQQQQIDEAERRRAEAAKSSENNDQHSDQHGDQRGDTPQR